ncbi:MAG: hypothetical protein ABFD16_10350 [Thermoguttaceae bacterium]
MLRTSHPRAAASDQDAAEHRGSPRSFADKLQKDVLKHGITIGRPGQDRVKGPQIIWWRVFIAPEKPRLPAREPLEAFEQDKVVTSGKTVELPLQRRVFLMETSRK